MLTYNVTEGNPEQVSSPLGLKLAGASKLDDGGQSVYMPSPIIRFLATLNLTRCMCSEHLIIEGLEIRCTVWRHDTH